MNYSTIKIIYVEMKSLLLFAVMCFVNQCGASGLIGSELVFAHIVVRHGDRNVLYPFGSTDPFSNETKYWPDGYGALTNEGRQQQYEVGLYLAKRYKKFIGNGYHRDKIYVRSTDVDRTLISAAHILAEIDDFVLATKRPCPRYKAARHRIDHSDEVKAVVADHAEYFKNLTDLSGKPIIKIDDVNTLYQILTVQKLKKLEPFPEWAEDLITKGSLMENITNYKHSFYGSTTEMARIRPGFLFKEILERFSKKANGTLDPDRSLHLYSAHDITIANILGGLGVFDDPHIPPYSSCVFFELHKTGENYHIEIYYKKERGADKRPLQPLKLRCGTMCPLNEFYKAYNDILPTGDYDTECKLV
ncbi:prostatic acid phosphatase-like isoform X2 [Contarinia nasturtii]|uniref:prostatic acid phosphatase-like isoform X2 n=1 Tax=Contarinia nasturtii TaxID=265458 RepID=UPI0012D403B6|nr:prostatic acid phosphatase-like isoform X2 [Contarinia nasturtii]